MSERRVFVFREPEKRPEHWIKAITAEGIRREIEPKTYDQVVSLCEKINDGIMLAKEQHKNKLAEAVATGVGIPHEWLRRFEASLRIQGLQYSILCARRGELRKQAGVERKKIHDEKECWAHHFFQVARASLSPEALADLAEETDRRTGTVRPEGFVWRTFR